MLALLSDKGYRVVLLTFLFDLFLFDSKIKTICKDKKMKRTIKQRFVFIGTLAAALILLGYSLSIEVKGKEEVSLKDEITFIEIESSSKFEVQFKEDGKKTGIAIFEYNKDNFCWEITIKKGDGTVTQITKDEYYGFISEVGTIDLSENENEDIFFVTESGGTGGHLISLSLINIKKEELIRLSLWFSSQATEAVTQVSMSDYFFAEDFQREEEFLESIKYEYGYIGEKEINEEIDNPDFAYYFWAKDNGSIEDGRMNIRRYKGQRETRASVNDELRRDGITYTAYFKGGVVGYDEESNEHFVLFHPDDMYSWPTVLRLIGPYLLIGTRGEGLAIINLQSFHLKRYRLSPPNDEVGSLEVLHSKIVVNEQEKIDLPDF